MELLPDPELDEYEKWKAEGRRVITRMDSFMCSLHGKHMNRLELLYTSNMINIRYMAYHESLDQLPESLGHYLEPNDDNAVIYYRTTKDTKDEMQATRLAKVFDEALLVQNLMEKTYATPLLENLYEYQTLVRVIDEQSVVVDEKSGRRELKNKHDISADSTQNVFNAFMAYRWKYHANYGASINVVDVVDTHGNGQIIDCAVEPATYEDVDHLVDYIERNPLKDIAPEHDCHVDGGFEERNSTAQAEAAGIHLHFSNLGGKAPNDFFADFKVDEQTKKVIECCCGHCPCKQSTNKSGNLNMWFAPGCCAGCEHAAQCKPTVLKSGETRVTIGENTIYHAQMNREIHSMDGKANARKRNSIEGVVSALRRRFRIDNIMEFDIDRARSWMWVCLMGYNLLKYGRWLKWKAGQKKAA